MSSAPESARVALVTGASRGIGRAVALALAAAGCHVVALARTQGGAGGTRRRDSRAAPRRRDPGDVGRLAISRLSRHRPARRSAAQALGAPRRSRRHRRRAGPIVAAPPRRPKAVGRRDGGQRHRELAAHPGARPAAAPIASRAGGIHHFGRGEPRGVARLLGPLRRLQGGARRARAHLRRRNRQHLGDPRHAGQSRTAAHPHARFRDAGRRPDDACARPRSSPPRSSRCARRNGARPASSTTSPTTG